MRPRLGRLKDSPQARNGKRAEFQHPQTAHVQGLEPRCEPRGGKRRGLPAPSPEGRSGGGQGRGCRERPGRGQEGRGRGGVGGTRIGSAGAPTSSGAGCLAEVRQLLSARGAAAAATVASRAQAPQLRSAPRPPARWASSQPLPAASRPWGVPAGPRPRAAERWPSR